MAVRVVSFLVGLTVLVAGCSSDPPASTLPPLPSASASPSTSPVSQTTSAGASAFVRFYLDGVNAAFVSGRADFLREYSDAACTACRKLIQAVEAPRSADEQVQGGDYLVDAVATPPINRGRAMPVLTYRLSAVRVVDGAGRVVRERPGQSAVNATMALTAMRGTWKVVAFEDVT